MIRISFSLQKNVKNIIKTSEKATSEPPCTQLSCCSWRTRKQNQEIAAYCKKEIPSIYFDSGRSPGLMGNAGFVSSLLSCSREDSIEKLKAETQSCAISIKKYLAGVISCLGIAR